MDQHARIVVKVVGVAADVRTAVDHQHALAQAGGQAFGQHAAGKAGADNQVIETTPAAAAAALGGQRCAAGSLQGVHVIFSFIKS